MRRFLIFLLAVVITGCAADRAAMTRFYPDTADSSGKTWRYQAEADLVYPVDSEKAEATRMEWLETWVAENRPCAAGYKVVNRQPVLSGPTKSRYTIYYTVRCQ